MNSAQKFTCFDSHWQNTVYSCEFGAVMVRQAISCGQYNALLRGEWLRHTKGSWHVIFSCLPCSGLSKSLGLIEGFGGRGKGGLPATLSPAEESDAKYLREKYGYNAYLSDRISLDRTIPDHRPSKWVQVKWGNFKLRFRWLSHPNFTFFLCFWDSLLEPNTVDTVDVSLGVVSALKRKYMSSIIFL